jgi:parallel beta-helix repeat protein
VSFRDSFFGELEITWYTIALPTLILAKVLIHDRRYFDSEIQLPNYALGQLDIDNTLSFEIPADTPIGAVDVAQGLTPYQLQDGDTPELLATKYGVELDAIIDPSGAWAELDTVQFQMPFKDHSAYREGLNVGQNPASISYLTENNTIFVSGFGAVVDMPTLHEEIAKDALIEYEGKGVYYLKANIWLDRHTTLLLEGPELSWLKLKSDDEGYVKIESVGGSLSANGVRVSSYDPMLNDYDKKHEDGRSYILIRNGRMDFVNSDIGYLGFSLENAGGKGGVYGVSWRIVDQEAFGQELTTGYVENSRFHHNYFGIYTFGATGMVFRNNEMYENIQYGFDPHDDSNNFIIEHNYAHDNGNHGLIISRRCFNNILRWNRSENNALHGIMLDRQSNGNSIYENILAGNGDGVALWDSHNNAIFDNQIVGNTRGIRLNRLSSGNVVRNNRIEETTQYGVYVYDEAAGNQIIDNELQNNEVGIYLRSQTNHVFANSIAGSTSGVYLTTEASGNRIAKNSLTNNVTGVYLKTHADDYVLDNVFVANQNNLKISSAWRLVPPGGYPQ